MLLRLVISCLFLSISLSSFAGNSATVCTGEAKPCLAYGAQVFQDRCVLCHGSDGLGEGILPLSLKGYPDTSLLIDTRKKDFDGIKKAIVFGGSLEGISDEMPPWGDELTLTQIDSVSQFIAHMHKDFENALVHLKKAATNVEPSLKIGRAVFIGRCSLCHGKYGQGDGKMARIIKNPPPFNLTLSRAPDTYLSEIIHKGGGEMGRSARMPPFGGDLSEPEIKSVIMHLKTLRVY